MYNSLGNGMFETKFKLGSGCDVVENTIAFDF